MTQDAQTQTNPQQYTFKAEIQQLLNILIHSLYTEREIFLRELISNSSDALNRLQFEQLTNPNILNPELPLEIRVVADEAAGTLTVSDTGIGMTRDDLANNLGVIAHSGAKAFVDAIKAQNAANAPLQDVIGQFGVGFYSAFMAADRIRVVSRHAHAGDEAWAWESDGGETYTIEPAERETRGTDIILHLKDDAKDFLRDWTLREMIRRHSDYIAFPIYVGEVKAPAAGDETAPDTAGADNADNTPVNKQQAIWRRDPKEVTPEAYAEFYKSLTYDFTDPLHTIHTRTEGSQEFYSLLYIPASGERAMLSPRQQPGLKLYARKVLISEYNNDLLPDYLNAFMHGVVDSEDIPLNVSRESVQATRVMANLKKTLTGKILTDLKRLMKKDAGTYRQIFETHGRYLKQGLVTTPTDREQLEPLLLFASTRTEADELVSLETYVERMAANQQEIYYVVAADEASARRSPHLDAFRQRGIEVLYLTDAVDSFMLMGLPAYGGHTLRSADDSEIDLSGIGEVADEAEQAEPVAEDEFARLRDFFVATLGERVEGVRESKALVGSPARLVAKDSAVNFYRVNRLLDREAEAPRKTLELNPRHPLIRQLSHRLNADNGADDGANDATARLIAEQVLDTALLQDGLHPDPAAMAERLYALMEAAARA